LYRQRTRHGAEICCGLQNVWFGSIIFGTLPFKFVSSFLVVVGMLSVVVLSILEFGWLAQTSSLADAAPEKTLWPVITSMPWPVTCCIPCIALIHISMVYTHTAMGIIRNWPKSHIMFRGSSCSPSSSLLLSAAVMNICCSSTSNYCT